jgi:hypothetical protein
MREQSQYPGVTVRTQVSWTELHGYHARYAWIYLSDLAGWLGAGGVAERGWFGVEHGRMSLGRRVGPGSPGPRALGVGVGDVG